MLKRREGAVLFGLPVTASLPTPLFGNIATAAAAPSPFLPFPLDKVTQGHARRELGRVNQSVLMSYRQALAMRSEWHSFHLGDEHVHRGTTGHY
jgi:hypothetical protein